MSSGEWTHAVGIGAPANASQAPTRNGVTDHGASGAAGVSEDEVLARLRWRSRRGILELDVLLERFVQGELEVLSTAERSQFEALLELPDPDLLDVLYGRAEPLPALAALIRRIRQT